MNLPSGPDLLEYKRPAFIMAETLAGYSRKMFQTLPLTYNEPTQSWVSSGNYNLILDQERKRVKEDLNTLMGPITLLSTLGWKPLSSSEAAKVIASQPLLMQQGGLTATDYLRQGNLGTVTGLNKSIQMASRKRKKPGLMTWFKKFIGRK